MQVEPIDGTRIFVIDDFLSPDECAEHVARSEQAGYEQFTVDGEVIPGFRTNSRLIVDDDLLAESLWQRAAEHLPGRIDAMPASGFNPRFRYYRYTGNEAFAPHYDGAIRIGERVSKLTFMVYLTDVPIGGETQFYRPGLEVAHAIRPTRGKALVFEHTVLHEGVAVEQGSKYVLRTDVMYG